MTKILHNILIAGVILSLNCAPIAAYAMPEPVPAQQTDKQKAAEKKKKEQEKAKAQKAKEAEKAKAAKEKEKAKAAKEKEKEREKAAKEKEKAAQQKEKAAEAKQKENEKKKSEQAKANEKAAAEREKAAEQRAKVAAEREEAKAKKEAEAKAKEEEAIRKYEKYQDDLANPKTEVVSFFNLGLRAGYAAMMDKFNGAYMGAGTINQSNSLQQLVGGGGAGLDLTYNLEYGHLRFETGLDFRFLNSTSNYGFQLNVKEQNSGSDYFYLFDKLPETRNMFQIGIPVMIGAQFSRYYFLVGAKVHYSLMGSYSHSKDAKYDILVQDPDLFEPYGRGIYNINGQTAAPIKFKQPDLSVAVEVGIDLDEWLQQQPSNDKDAKKKRQSVKAGQRLPFGREHIHYRVGLFAEYGVLNTNATPAALPANFKNDELEIQSTNTLLALNGDTKLNNLLVGAKFAIQFEVPGKKARPVPPPPAYAIYSVVNAETNEPIDKAFIETRGTENGKIALREKQISAKGFRQKHALGNYTVDAHAENYYPASQQFTIEKVGATEYITIALHHRPVLRVRVTNKETGLAVPANVQIRKQGVAEPAYSLATDSTAGTTSQMLEEGPQYSLHIAQMGYDTIDMVITNIGDSLNIQLVPVKKGEVFIVHNLFFATNKTRILARSEEALNDLYMYLARNPQVRIKIVGHTDSVGKDEANQKLSEGRANEVMKELIERGIAPDRILSEGRGESQPIDTNDTEEGRQNNRRVEIEIQ